MIVGRHQAYYVRELLGNQQSITPEGFLLCRDTPIYRTGQMLYGPGEVFTEIDGVVQPLEIGADGVTYVERAAEDVFRPETLASFEGKSVVNLHPDEDVNPDNWRQLTSGVALHVRRGVAAQDDVALADLLITNKDEIEAVHHGLREVSCGYTAKYEKIGPARYRQYDIIGNHIALVPNGRCGSRCSIGDSKPILTEDCGMTWLEKLKAAIGAKDQAAIDAALAEAPKDQVIVINQASRTHDAEHKEDCDCAMCKGKKTTDARMKKVEDDVKEVKDSVDRIAKDVKSMKDESEKEKEEEEKEKKKTEDNTAIEGSLEMEAPPGTGDEAKKAKDSRYFADSWQEAMSLAEVIAPGYQAPTLDARAAPKSTLDAICKFRKGVLELARAKPETKSFTDNLLGGRDLAKLTCDETRTVFRAVGGYAKSLNNSRTDDGPNLTSGNGSGVVGKVKTPADLNKRMTEMYK
jgi:hypothetical protein